MTDENQSEIHATVPRLIGTPSHADNFGLPRAQVHIDATLRRMVSALRSGWEFFEPSSPTPLVQPAVILRPIAGQGLHRWIINEGAGASRDPDALAGHLFHLLGHDMSEHVVEDSPSTPIMRASMAEPLIEAPTPINPVTVDEASRFNHFVHKLLAIRVAVRGDTAGAVSTSREYREAAEAYQLARSHISASVPVERYVSRETLAALQEHIARLCVALDTVRAQLPQTPTGTTESPEFAECTAALHELRTASLFSRVRLHLAGDDTSWLQGSASPEYYTDIRTELQTNDYIIVSTGPVQFPMYSSEPGVADVPGGFELMLPMRATNREDLWVIALNPVYSMSGGYIHPNVASGSLCFGNGGAAATNALRRGDLLSYFTIIKTVLSSFSSSPHHSGSDWDRTRRTCAACGNRIAAGSDAATYQNAVFHQGCMSLSMNLSGAQELTPVNIAAVCAWSGVRELSANRMRAEYRGISGYVAARNIPEFRRVGDLTLQGIFVCPRCNAEHADGIQAAVNWAADMNIMTGCRDCLRVDGLTGATDPRTGGSIEFMGTPVFRRAIVPLRAARMVPCPCCNVRTVEEQLQSLVADSGLPVITCPACDPGKLGTPRNFANLPVLLRIANRLTAAYIDNLLADHSTPFTSADPVIAYNIAKVITNILNSSSITAQLNISPTLTFAAKQAHWRSVLTQVGYDFDLNPLFTATPEQIRQHDNAAAAIFSATFGAQHSTADFFGHSGPDVWSAHDPGVPGGDHDVIADPSGNEGNLRSPGEAIHPDEFANDSDWEPDGDDSDDAPEPNSTVSTSPTTGDGSSSGLGFIVPSSTPAFRPFVGEHEARLWGDPAPEHSVDNPPYSSLGPTPRRGTEDIFGAG